MTPLHPPPRAALRPLACAILGYMASAGAVAESNPPAAWLAQAEQLAERMADAVMPSQRLLLPAGGDADPMAASLLDSERVVKGAPYCADAVHETLQWLPDADGGPANRIVRQRITRLCRDSEGRTRQEVGAEGKKRIFLHDPHTRESWQLDVERKVARRLGGGTWAMGQPADLALMSGEWRAYAERMREWARHLGDRWRPGAAASAPPSPLPPLPPLPARLGAAPASQPGAQREVRVQVLRADGAEGGGMLPPGLALRAESLAPRGQGVVMALPSREIDGLRLDGERTTWTIEAGKVGNERPIVISREVWRSPELLLTVHSRDIDPRSGETNYRLANLKRGEPDAALFKVPPDYEQRGLPAMPRTPASPGARG